MTEEERKELAEKFVKTLNEIGIKDIKDIPEAYKPPKERTEVWVIKG